jgi:hypothetical protein
MAGALVVVSVTITEAQIYESVGIRAQGMAGAFVAVADDATSTWWNPAGLASGAYFNAIVEYGQTQEPRVATGPGGAALPSWRINTRGLAVAFPALGLSYYRLRVSQIQPIGATAANGPDRQDQGRTPVRSTSLALQQFGATAGQSLGDHLVLGSTVKVVRGGFASAAGVAADASLDGVVGLRAGAENRVDLDLGAMAKFGGVRVGLAAKNVREPSFGSGDARLTLAHQLRAGLSLTSERRGTAGPFVVAVDADLSRTPTATGDARHVAAGVEAWLFSRSLGLRGGVSANTTGQTRSAASGGVSLALRSGTYVDGEGTFGSDQERRGWGLALRVTF